MRTRCPTVVLGPGGRASGSFQTLAVALNDFLFPVLPDGFAEERWER